MAFCTQCGTETEKAWRFCPSCGATTIAAADSQLARNPSADLESEALVTAAPPQAAASGWVLAAVVLVLVAAGAAVTVAALFPAYYAGGRSLAADANNLWYNVPVIVGWTAAAALLTIPSARRAGVGLVAGVTIVDATYFVQDVGSVLSGDNHPGSGFFLGVAGFGLCSLGAALAAIDASRRRPFRWRTGRAAAGWAALMCCVGAAFATGLLLPALAYHVHLAKGTFNATGSSSLTTTCCNPLRHQHGYAIAGTIATVGLAVLLPLVAATLWPRIVGSALFAGTGIALAADWAATSAHLATTTATPAMFGYTDDQVSQLGVTVALHPAIGYWVETAAAAALAVLVVARLVAGGGGPGNSVPEQRAPGRHLGGLSAPAWSAVPLAAPAESGGRAAASHPDPREG